MAENQNLIQFYIDDETLKQIEQLKARFSHQMPSGKMEDLMKILIKKVNKPARPRTKKTQADKGQRTSTITLVLTQTPNQAPNPTPTPPSTRLKKISIKTRSRYISAVAKRELEKTRPHGCAYKDKSTGQRCGSTYFLQLDHIHEFCNGGSNAAENLQWLCGFHNRHRFETRDREAAD